MMSSIKYTVLVLILWIILGCVVKIIALVSNNKRLEKGGTAILYAPCIVLSFAINLILFIISIIICPFTALYRTIIHDREMENERKMECKSNDEEGQPHDDKNDSI